ncbi:MAG: response regulator [Gemmatimonadaceae bacterium]
MTATPNPDNDSRERGYLPLRVLVVDDEPSICRALAIALRRAGCEAVIAPDGDAALDVLRSQPVDVLILDLRMIGMRGDSLFHLAAAIQPQLREQTLFITGDVTDRAESLIRSCGVPYLRKPFALNDVIQLVFALVPQRRSATA